jgi:hypothetical protein
MFIASPQFIGMAYALSMIENQFPISPIEIRSIEPESACIQAGSMALNLAKVNPFQRRAKAASPALGTTPSVPEKMPLVPKTLKSRGERTFAGIN